MRIDTGVEEQLASVKDDRIRVLIAGAGVAGLTLAAALRADDLHPVVVERAAPDADEGYMLALMPIVDPVMEKIGADSEYRSRSQPLHRYRMRDRHGHILRTYLMDSLLASFGDYRGIARGDLLAVLSATGVPVSFETHVSGLEQTPDVTRASITDAEARSVEAEFDLVIAADGLHSATRRLVLREDQVDTFDSGWGGWVAWSESVPDEADLSDEIWGAGFFLGTYPVKGKIGVILCGDRRDTEIGPAQFVRRARADLRITEKRETDALNAVASARDPYFWKLTDCRAAMWSVGRVGLIGDAAAGFLPTAGIGAAMAMEAAGQLAKRIATTDRQGIIAMLQDYERAERPRVEAAQDNSRQLARLVFRRNEAVSAVRDVAARFIPLNVALGPIRKLHEEAPAA